MTGARKLVVEVISAKDLMPKDGHGSSNAYCVLDYDGQRKRTKVKSKDLDPTWNEKFEFAIHDPSAPGVLEINVQNEMKGYSRCCGAGCTGDEGFWRFGVVSVFNNRCL